MAFPALVSTMMGMTVMQTEVHVWSIYHITNLLSLVMLVYTSESAPCLCGGRFFDGIVAATYFTGFETSIIGGAGLNFSVRDGKR